MKTDIDLSGKSLINAKIPILGFLVPKHFLNEAYLHQRNEQTRDFAVNKFYRVKLNVFLFLGITKP
jgi:hypothetical protein